MLVMAGGLVVVAGALRFQFERTPAGVALL